MIRPLLAFALLGACAAPEVELDEPEGVGAAAPPGERSPRIIGGTLAIHDHSVVALTTAGRDLICTGSLISPRVVLTAGHCVFTRPPALVYFGLDTPDLPGRYIEVRTAFAHPDYQDTNFRFADVGVVILREPAREPLLPLARMTWEADVHRPDAPVVAPGVASPLDDVRGPARRLRLVGYGFQLAHQQGEIGRRMTISVPITAWRPKEIQYFQGTCNGDSGGPALLREEDGVERIIGVTSGGAAGCVGFSFCHRVDRHEAWILEQIATWDPPSCESDRRCASGCPDADPDCPCSPEDGVCSALCLEAETDPDCPADCGPEGTCRTDCPAPDPDCGDPCGAEGHCLDACPERDPDCAPHVGVGEACGRDFDCEAGLYCLAAPGGGGRACTATCGSDADCPGDLECRAVLDGVRACRTPLAPGPTPAGHCRILPGRRRAAAAGALAAVAAVALALASASVMGRRRRSG